MMRNFLIIFIMAMMVTACASSNNGFLNGMDMNAVEKKLVQTDGINAPVVEVAEVPAPPVVEIVKVAAIYEAIMFPFDSTEIIMDEQAKLVKIADMLKEYPDTVVIIEGFASKEGTDEYNLILSTNRAEAVQAELLQMGVDADSIMAVEGQGETEDFDFTSLAPNRRVVVVTVN